MFFPILTLSPWLEWFQLLTAGKIFGFCHWCNWGESSQKTCIGTTSVTPLSDMFCFQKQASKNPEIVIPHPQGNFTISFTASLTAPATHGLLPRMPACLVKTVGNCHRPVPAAAGAQLASTLYFRPIRKTLLGPPPHNFFCRCRKSFFLRSSYKVFLSYAAKTFLGHQLVLLKVKNQCWFVIFN